MTRLMYYESKRILHALNVPKAFAGNYTGSARQTGFRRKAWDKRKYGKPGDICCSWYTFTGHARGFGFVTVEGMGAGRVYPEDKTGSALNGDESTDRH